MTGPVAPPDPSDVARDVARALEEDLGSGDVTAALLPDTGDTAYLLWAARRSSSPATVRAGAAVMAALTVIDGTTALKLRRS